MKTRQADKSSLVISGDWGCCWMGPAWERLASSELNFAPTSMAQEVQYSHTIDATAAPSVPYVL